MTMRSLVAVTLLAALCGCSTSSDTGEPGTAEAAGERECRPVKGANGSRLRQSVCRTPQEWEVADAEAKAKEDIQAEFFRRVGENAAQGQAPAFDDPSGGY